jgi:hypothetical protein
MTRKHRAAHRLFWPALGLAVALAFILALVQRAPAAPYRPQAEICELQR